MCITAGLTCIFATTYCRLTIGHPLHYIVRLVFVPLLLLGAWQFVPALKFRKWISNSVFPVYLLHFPVWLLFGCFLQRQVENLGDWFFWWFVGCMGPMGVSIVMRKYLGKLSLVVFGGR